MSAEAEIVEAEVVESELTIQQPPTTLFRTNDPVVVLERATETANALRDVIRKQGLAVNIHGKWHITIEAWQMCGAMLGVTAICEWTRPVEEGWEARVIAQTLDGRTIGAAEAQCLRTEKRWKSADAYAIRSMAQTRASSKALASVLRFIAVLGGYQGTPAEEMPHEAPTEPEKPSETIDASRAEQILAGFHTQKLNYAAIDMLLGSAGLDALRAKSKKAVTERIEGLTAEQADAVEAELRG